MILPHFAKMMKMMQKKQAVNKPSQPKVSEGKKV